MSREVEERYRFGDFELLPALRELRRKGRPVRLQPKPFDLLLYLVRNRDRVVPREEVLEKVWPGVAVSAEALAFSMHAVRKALGDDGTRQESIATIPRCGFRFVAAVEEGASPAPSPRSPDRRGKRNRASHFPFVGRESLLEEVAGLVQAACAGRGGTLLLSGEAGIGKTRAVEEIARLAGEAGCRVLTGRCSETEGSPLFWPWVQIVRAFTTGAHQEPLLRILGDGAPEIARLVPELREQLPDLRAAAEVESRTARFLLFDSMATFLRRAAETQPIVVALDDLHRADQPSLLLFEFIAQEVRAMSLLLVGTYREAEMHADPSRLAPISAVAREEGSRSRGLEGLRLSETAEFIRTVSGLTPSDAFSRHLHEQCNGNPFFLNQVLQVLAGEGRIREVERESQIELVLPRRVQDAITRQADALSKECRALLQAASVLGREFSLEALSRTARCDRETSLRLLEPAIVADIVCELDTPGEFRFSHALVRDALHQTLPPRARATLHGRAGRALEEIWGEECGPQSASLAHHFSQALTAGDGERALKHSVLAGDWAYQRLAFEEAPPQYERALQLLDLVDPANEVRRCELLLALGDAQTKAGKREAAREVLGRAARLAKRAGLPEKLAAAALRFAPDFLAIETGVYDAALVDLLEDALATMDVSDTELRARLLGRLAVALHWSDEAYERSTHLGAQATAMAERLGDRSTLAYVETARMLAEYSVESPEVYLDADPGVLLAKGDEPIALLRQLLRITSLLHLGRIAEVDAAIEDFSVLAEKLRQPHSLWYVDLLRATRAQMEGRLDEAESLRNQFLAKGLRARDRNAIHSALAQGVLSSLDTGGVESYRKPVFQIVSSFPRVPGWRSGLAMTHAEIGLTGEAARDLDWLISSKVWLRRKRNDWFGSVAGMAVSANEIGHREAASVLYDQLLPHAQHLVVVGFSSYCWGSTHRLLGGLAAVLGDYCAAVEHFESALRLNSRVGARAAMARTMYVYGKFLLKEERDQVQARALLHEGVELAEEMGMARLRQLIRTALE